MTRKTALPWCKAGAFDVETLLRHYLRDRCQCRPEGPTWCKGGEPWTPARVADLTWGRMHL